MEALHFDLLNDFQHDFPRSHRPFQVIAARLGADERTVVSGFDALRRDGSMVRIGAVFRPNTVGASTLAAMAVPGDRIDEVAGIVNGFAGINHNYLREHEINLWFVATAPDDAALDAELGQIETATGCQVLRLPLIEPFHLDLGFDLSRRARRTFHGSALPQRLHMSPIQREIVRAIEQGLPLVPEPYRQLAQEHGLDPEMLLRQIDTWLDESVISRFGVVVRHLRLGYVANAMLVWDIPDERASEVGRRLAAESCVTLCYRRARAMPRWPYNLYCMVHGTEREQVLRQARELTERAGIGDCAHAQLFQARAFKQRGARYTREQLAA